MSVSKSESELEYEYDVQAVSLSSPAVTATSGDSDRASVPNDAPDEAPDEEPKRASLRRKVPVLKARTTETGFGVRSDSWQANPDPEAVRYFTPPWLLDEVYRFFEPETGSLDRVDLDPCMDPEAFVSASTGYDIRRGEDGLALPWDLRFQGSERYDGPLTMSIPGVPARVGELWIRTRVATVFCNPPYDKPGPWFAKGAEHYARGGSAIFLVNAAPGTRAWRQYVFGCPGALVCFLSRRVTFYKRGSGYEGPNNRDSAVIYYGRDHRRFYERFSPLGTIVAPWFPPSLPLSGTEQ